MDCYLDTFKIPISTNLERICDEAFSETIWVNSLENDSIVANFILYKYLGQNKTYVIDKDIERIAEGAFINNKNLEYLDITGNSEIALISAYAFCNCTSFKGFISDANPEGDGLYFKKNVKEIGAYAFYSTHISRIVLQTQTLTSANKLHRIGEKAFAACDRLGSAEISSVLKDLAHDAFEGCYSLEEFVLKEPNQYYYVYDGILYFLKGNSGEYSLYSYPAGRIDAEFDPLHRRNYAISLVKDENIYLTTPNEPVGAVKMNGNTYNLYMGVNGNLKLSRSAAGGTTVLYGGKELTETEKIAVDQEGNNIYSGQKYFFFNDGTDNIYLLYDKERNNYYYEIALNVTEIEDYSLYYSNIGALNIPATISFIGDKAINIPGLMYIVFNGNPMVNYEILFAQNEPEYVVFPTDANISETVKKNFFSNDSVLYSDKCISEKPVWFFYDYDKSTDKFDRTILYANDVDQVAGKTYVVRTSRSADTIYVPETVDYVDEEGEINIYSDKFIYYYAFYGAKVENVYLKNVDTIMDYAFYRAYNMTKLDLNSRSFIQHVGKDAFGEKKNNGLYIHDYSHGVDLYKNSADWGLSFFSFISPSGYTQYASKYLITSENGAYAVIWYYNGTSPTTVDIVYGSVDKAVAKALQTSIAKTGYDIANWSDKNGNILSEDYNYDIKFNQIIVCNFVPQTYEIYLSASPSITLDYYVDKTDASGLVTYKTTVTYDSEYDFTPSVNTDNKHVFWRIGEEKISSSGIWEHTFVIGEKINLQAVFGYKLTFEYNCEEEVTYTPTTEFVFNAESFNLGVPVAEGKTFKCWALSDGENVIELTDNTGASFESWFYTEQNDYTVYAIWQE